MTQTQHPSEVAHVSRTVLASLQSRINSPSCLPPRALRRNSGTYPLLCYVNAITGLFLSENLEPIPLFIARAAEHMKEHPPSAGEAAYYDLVLRYISQMAYHLREHAEGIEFPEDRIPASVLNAGPQRDDAV